MTGMTLKSLMGLSGVDMNSPKVTMLIESDQRVTELVKRIEDDIHEYAHEMGASDEQPQNPESEISWAPPSWNSGRDIWNEMRQQASSTTEAADALEALIGHEKTQRLIIDIANSVFDQTQQDTSPEPYLG